MNNKKRNIDILKRIVKYCDEIFETQKHFGNSYDIFEKNFIYRNAISMCILQIGELSGYLSENFKDTYNEVPWKNIRGMRNFMAHRYGNLDIKIVWETVNNDIPSLYNYCNDILEKYQTLEQLSEEVEDDWDLER